MPDTALLEPDGDGVLQRGEPEGELSAGNEALCGPVSDATGAAGISVPEADQDQRGDATEPERPSGRAAAAEVQRIIAEVDAVLAAYYRDVVQAEIRARLTPTTPSSPDR